MIEKIKTQTIKNIIDSIIAYTEDIDVYMKKSPIWETSLPYIELIIANDRYSLEDTEQYVYNNILKDIKANPLVRTEEVDQIKILATNESNILLITNIYIGTPKNTSDYIKLTSDTMLNDIVTENPFVLISNKSISKGLKAEFENHIYNVLVSIQNLLICIISKDKLTLILYISRLTDSIISLCKLLHTKGIFETNYYIGQYIPLYINDQMLEFSANIYDALKNDDTYRFQSCIRAVFEILSDLFLRCNEMGVVSQQFYNYINYLEKAYDSFLMFDICLKPKSCVKLSEYTENISYNYDDSHQLNTSYITALKDLSSKCLKGKDVLELGAGTGELATNIIELVNSYIGIEKSQYMCNVFEKKINNSSIRDKIKIINEDILFLDEVVKDKVDVVIEKDSLFLVTDIDLVLGKIRKILKPGGLLIRLIDKRDADSVFTNFMNLANREISIVEKKPIVIRGTDSNLVINYYLSRNGVTTEKVHLSKWTESFDVESIMKVLKNKQLPYLQYVSDKAIDQAIEKIHLELLQNNTNLNKKYSDNIECYCLVSKFNEK